MTTPPLDPHALAAAVLPDVSQRMQRLLSPDADVRKEVESALDEIGRDEEHGPPAHRRGRRRLPRLSGSAKLAGSVPNGSSLSSTLPPPHPSRIELRLSLPPHAGTLRAGATRASLASSPL